ncbi:two-component response regulator ARR11-like [Solanum pennellii]|uniref:Two-component response regulator ARR11-like n=1 Tax=Solanum pennellii TaxID=28526 RepID=A0ABM1UVK5_SOLPN|nr:two-component response regulator ARR11-like [Solanum pennellii]
MEGINNPMSSPYYGKIEHVHVMLVDNDKEFTKKMTDFLTFYEYKVVTVDTALAAMSMLKEKQKIDVMILNVHPSNIYSFDLLAQAVVLDIVTLVVYDELNELVAKKALDKGAYLSLKKPFDEEILQYLWQIVLKRNTQQEKAREGSEMKNVSNINEGESQSNATNMVVRRKYRTKWTDELHTKFMKVVEQLGDGNCYPKKIFELMQVPGLTRIQIASHLQKCRRNNWRSRKEQRYVCAPSGHESKFGAMPRLQTNVLNPQRNSDEIQKGSWYSFSTPDANNVFARGDNSIQQEFNNNVGGGLQPETLFGMSSSQELEGSITGNTNYKPAWAFNNGDHDHAQYAYNNLNLNAAYGTIYSNNKTLSGANTGNVQVDEYNVNAENVAICSDNAMMSDTYVGNVAINGVGETNTNFQQYIDESDIFATLCESDIDEADASEKEDCEAYYLNTEYLL